MSYNEIPAMTPVVVNDSSRGNGDGGMGGLLLGGVFGLTLANLLDRHTDGLNSLAVNQAVQTGTITTEILGMSNAISNGINANTIANLQGLNGVTNQIAVEGRASDANLFNQTTAILNSEGQIKAELCDIGREMATGFGVIGTSIVESRYQMALLDKDIQLQNQTNTCAITNTIHCEGEKTRAQAAEIAAAQLAFSTNNIIADKNLQIDILSEEVREGRRNRDNDGLKQNVNQLSLIVNNVTGSLNRLSDTVNQIATPVSSK